MYIYLRYDAPCWLVVAQTIKADALTEKVVGRAATLSDANRLAVTYSLKHPPGKIVVKK